ncbi:hypothetical protein K1719_025982 [Acacia pycnantha]|nr:hypothetical protein K1719_025982 [Acacia pycnantha]
MPPHTDHGLLTLLYQNGIGGLQVNHDGRWVNVNPLPNCLIVNTADQLEALSNGRYKSIWHRAVLNNKDTRLSIVVANGPDLEEEIAPRGVCWREGGIRYKKMKYGSTSSRFKSDEVSGHK